MAGSVKIKASGNPLLGPGGSPAVDCDCAGCGAYACQACSACCWHLYTASGVCPGSSARIRLTYTLYPNTSYAGYEGDCTCKHEGATPTGVIYLEFMGFVAGDNHPRWLNNCQIASWQCGGLDHNRMVVVEYSCTSGGSSCSVGDAWTVGFRMRDGYDCGQECDAPDVSNFGASYMFCGLTGGGCTGGTWTGTAALESGTTCGGTGDLQIEVLQNACCKCATGGSCKKTSDYENSAASPCNGTQDGNCP